MKKFRHILLCSVLLLLSFRGNSQSHSLVDSLSAVLETAKDTQKVNVLNLLSKQFWARDPEKSIRYAEQARELSEKYKFQKGKGDALNNIGFAEAMRSNYDTALSFLFKALKIRQNIKDQKGMAGTYNNLGVVFHLKGNNDTAVMYYEKCLHILEKANDKIKLAAILNNVGELYVGEANYPKALSYHFRSLKIKEEIKDSFGIATSLNNIGIIYRKQDKLKEAKDFNLQSLKIKEALRDKKGISTSYINLALISSDEKKFDLSFDYYNKALKLLEELGDKRGVSNCLNNLGINASRKGNKALAKDYYLRAFAIEEEIGDKDGQALALSNIGQIILDEGKAKEAITYFEKAITISKEIKSNEWLRDSYGGMHDAYYELKDYKNALYYFGLYTEIKDSILNETSNKQLVEIGTKYQTEKKDNEIKFLNKDKIIQATELENQKMVRNSFIGGFLLVLTLAFFILRGYKQKQKANQLLEEKNATIELQKQLVEEHQKEIIDSITYAKRIQEAILPPAGYMKEYLPQSFILYQPKDIVAGDFYWMEVVNDLIFIAAADCTGHGVPGAMVSVVCSAALNRTVKEFGITDTGKILDKVTELVLETFERSGSDVKDGMDISLLAINKKSKQVQWSGANNSLLYIDNGAVKELKADKQPIGKFDQRKPFAAHVLQLSESNVFYLFTDGYADQFGGTKGKKFKYAQLKEVLLANHQKPMQMQQKLLFETLNAWKGNLSQVDDVCILGIKL